jgi:hypothetical protein
MNDIMALAMLIMSLIWMVQGDYPHATFMLVFSYGLKFTNAFHDVMEAIKERK